ncbi:hypothetical protein T552_03248 [Pneumocystis carinii B80]|uniref:Exocyst complex component Sec3 PIP2-binding N-terminal domain-containing protein n=1 Tax=Pneumocystis carinii (strain B80) TaxID=1408658 RepID=A0A0W4ZC67_PNEC8|nr:hypothetical protein T552_03248 [Pneumocystis carinii B80]KTW25974.1 hypothetical protein T552_03248 [Pneumocystis carinii B80]
MASTDDSNNTKIRIIRSLFSNRTENGDLIENYITHVKVFEESHYLFPDGQSTQHTTRKRRCILISVKNNGKVQVHKSRENSNGTFSIGKTWDMSELQRIDNVDAYKMIVTFQKPYHWICESTKDKMFFIEVLVKIYKKFTGGKVPIMNGFEETKNFDSANNVESDTPLSRRLSHASYEHRNANDSVTKHYSFSSQQRRKSSRNSQSSEKYSSNRSSSLSHHSLRFSKGHKETFSFSSNQYLFSDSLSQIMEKQNSGSFSLNSTLSEKFENNNTSKHNSDLSSIKSPSFSIFRNKDKKSPSDSCNSLNKDFFQKTKFFDDLAKPLKKNDYEIVKSPSNYKDVDDIINHIDQILDSFDWTSLENVDKLEEKLKDELSVLESENIQRIIESNNKMKELSKKLQPSIKECKKLNSILSLYSAELNTLKDDIFHIEIQNRGLQVQAANQKKLALELQNLLDTLSINVNDLEPLKKASFESTSGIMSIEKSLTFLYKALKIPASETDNEKVTDDIAIMMNKRAEYEKESNDFLSRLTQYLNNKFQTELSNLIYKDYSPTLKVSKPHLVNHTSTYMSFYRYQSFMLYAKHINHSMFSVFQECYIKYTRNFYNNNFENFFDIWKTIIKRVSLEETEFLFTSIKETPQSIINIKTGNIKRSVTTLKTYRSPNLDSWKEENQETKVAAKDAFFGLIKEIVTAITQEQNFITSFFHLVSAKKRDYAELVSWSNNHDDITDILKRKRPVESNRSVAKLVLNMMSKIMNFLNDNLVAFGEFCCKSDHMCILENIKSLEKFLLEWEKSDQEYLIRILNKLYFKHIEYFYIFIDTQVQAIENVKIISKRKQGILSFFRIFPDFVDKYIRQNPGSDNIEINELLDKALEKLNHAMFKTFNTLSEDTYNLSNTSKVDTDDKELLYCHIMVVENMFYYLQELKKKDIFILDLYIENANIKYQEHLNLYIENVIKRPLGRIIEFSKSIDALLKTKTIEEIKNRMSFSAVSLKRIIISYDIKEILKGIETLYKRIEKHFRNEENPYYEQLIIVVWNRINDEYKEIVKRFHQLVDNYYKTDGIYINWTFDDLESSFLRKGIM